MKDDYQLCFEPYVVNKKFSIYGEFLETTEKYIFFDYKRGYDQVKITEIRKP